MVKSFFVCFLLCFSLLAIGQKSAQPTVSSPSKPKLVLGIVIDQMRWDYLYRYQSLFQANGGFKKMMGDGFVCNNAFIPYTPTVTACGHTAVYTGSVPAIHGITGNAWWDNQLMKNIYCSEDKTVKGIGSKTEADGQMSPKNMLTTTITDELRIASNFTSKVIGIALKDRGAILPAGHAANAAYWYETKSGNFITSSYYMNELPDWVKSFNNRKLVDSFYRLGWNTSLDKSIYPLYSTADEKAYESKPFGKDALGFPYQLNQFIEKDYGKIASTPYGNSLTVEMAKAALVAEKLGKGKSTDFLAVSFSSPDYIGHSFGPNSWEMLDDYVKLDIEIGKLLSFLDKEIGKNEYTVFLTADHAVSHIPGFLTENKLPGGVVDDAGIMKDMNTQIENQFGINKAIVSMHNYQVYLNHPQIDSAKINKASLNTWIINYLKKKEGVANAFPTASIMTEPINKTLREMLVNGYFPNRSGEIQIIFKPGYIDGMSTGTTHGLWYPYDTHIPLLWYGNGINKGRSYKEVYMTDIASTLAALLNIQMPNGAVGKVITEVLK